MNRRSLLTALALSPLMPMAAKAEDDGYVPMTDLVPWTGGNPVYFSEFGTITFVPSRSLTAHDPAKPHSSWPASQGR